MSSACFGSFDDLVEEGCSFGLVVVAGVVSLAEQDGHELGSGGEVGACFACRFHAAGGRRAAAPDRAAIDENHKVIFDAAFARDGDPVADLLTQQLTPNRLRSTRLPADGPGLGAPTAGR